MNELELYSLQLNRCHLSTSNRVILQQIYPERDNTYILLLIMGITKQIHCAQQHVWNPCLRSRLYFSMFFGCLDRVLVMIDMCDANVRTTR